MHCLMSAIILSSAFVASANPYPDPHLAPKDHALSQQMPQFIGGELPIGDDVIRVQIDWVEDRWRFGYAVIESSGTTGLKRRSPHADKLGSYRAEIVDTETGESIGHDSIGTGAAFRKLTRALTFRFPKPSQQVELIIWGEDPETGAMQEILRTSLDPSMLERTVSQKVEAKWLKKADQEPSLRVAIYAEGYTAKRQDQFWRAAQNVVDSLFKSKFPGVERMSFVGVFASSNNTIGQYAKLATPVPERDTFLGLYYPYWYPLERWYHVVYPTREKRYRDGIGQVAYDYPIVIVDNSYYWGVGNYNELTAIPADNSSFTYLLLHEFGHFFGLNEEYEGGGPTELEFAPGIEEPWSQNITFLNHAENLKWKIFVEDDTPVPTPISKWRKNGPYGAYKGGYASSRPQGHSHKPGLACTMDRSTEFCPICRAGILAKIQFDLGDN